MNDLTIFENAEFGQVRTVIIKNEPWFVGKDVSDALGYSETNAMTKRLDKEDFISDKLEGMNMKSTLINESGLYSAVLCSQLESAKKFKKWVTSEVLPSIRNHGTYMTSETIEKTLTDPDFIIRLAQELKKEKEERKRLESEKSMLVVENITMKPKAEYFDELVDRNLLTGIRETAKELIVKEKSFVEFLINKKYIYRDLKGKLMPYAKKNDGLFELKECFNDGTNWKGTQTLITPKGRETFRLLLSGLRE